MRLCPKPSCAARPASTLAALLLFQTAVIAGEPAKPHFWDEIPASPSTTPPAAITDDYWHGQFQRVNREVAVAEGAELVFFGDSITWSWSLGPATGKKIWEETYGKYKPINMGNSGDITPVMLHRTTHGNLAFPAGKEPKVAVLLCGTNNFVVNQSDGGKVRWELGPDCPPEDVAAGMRAIAQSFRRAMPRFGGVPFQVNAPQLESSVIVTAGTGYAFTPNLMMNIGYRGDISLEDSGITSHGATLGFSYSF